MTVKKIESAVMPLPCSPEMLSSQEAGMTIATVVPCDRPAFPYPTIEPVLFPVAPPLLGAEYMPAAAVVDPTILAEPLPKSENNNTEKEQPDRRECSFIAVDAEAMMLAAPTKDCCSKEVKEASPPAPIKAKLERTNFNSHQLSVMRGHFQINQYPNKLEFKKLAEETNLDKKVLQVSCTLIKVIECHSSM